MDRQGTVTQLSPRKTRRLHETVYTDRGLMLSPVARLVEARWFAPCLLVLPIAVFLIVFLW